MSEICMKGAERGFQMRYLFCQKLYFLPSKILHIGCQVISGPELKQIFETTMTPPFEINDDTIGEAMGYFFVVLSALTFGSFAVPIKSERSKSVDVHPLVFQSYKTMTMFTTSWLSLLVKEFNYTPWG